MSLSANMPCRCLQTLAETCKSALYLMSSAMVDDGLAYKDNILHKWGRFCSILDKMCTEYLKIVLKETKFDAWGFGNNWMLTCTRGKKT